MLAARLYGPQDMRVDEIDPPGEPGAGEVLVAVKSVGICGSDLHNYQDGRIGDTLIESPIILGHEFSAEVLAVGPDARDVVLPRILEAEPDLVTVVAPAHAPGDAFRIGIEDELVGIETVTLLWGIRPMDAVAIELPRPRIRQVAMPDEVGLLRHLEALLLAARLIE